ncbi:MAG: DICT sensory domain-containing protein [Kibdelosporangium sp.]
MDEIPQASRAGLLTKRSLVIASHAIEQAALAETSTESAVVLAMFQRLPYFEREHGVYAKIAARALVTIVGMVDTSRPDLPHGITPILLRSDEALAREWSVVVLSSRFGASVVAQDLEDVNPDAVSLESSRLFHGRWGLRRDEAYAETVRMRDLLGDRLPPAVRRQIDQILASAEEPPAVEVEQRAEAVVRGLVARLQRQRDEAARIAEADEQGRGHDRDPDTGLHTSAAITPWLGASADTVALGLVLLRISALQNVGERYGIRAGIHTGQNIADLIKSELRPVDRAVRLSATDFLLIKPAVSQEMLATTAGRVVERINELRFTYPFVETHCTSTRLLTRRRPLPLAAMRSQLELTVGHYEWPPANGNLGDMLATTAEHVLPAGNWYR